MARRVAMLALGAGLLVASSGCRLPWFNRCSGTGSGTGCGSGSVARTDSCFDPSAGMMVSGPTGGMPGTLIPSAGVPLLPGSGGLGPPPNELPPPERIPPTSVPSQPNAPRSPAGPGELGTGDGSKIARPVVGK